MARRQEETAIVAWEPDDEDDRDDWDEEGPPDSDRSAPRPPWPDGASDPDDDESDKGQGVVGKITSAARAAVPATKTVARGAARAAVPATKTAARGTAKAGRKAGQMAARGGRAYLQYSESMADRIEAQRRPGDRGPGPGPGIGGHPPGDGWTLSTERLPRSQYEARHLEHGGPGFEEAARREHEWSATSGDFGTVQGPGQGMAEGAKDDLHEFRMGPDGGAVPDLDLGFGAGEGRRGDTYELAVREDEVGLGIGRDDGRGDFEW